MLGKLLKHEFKYSAKRFIPLYIAYCAAGALIRIIMLVLGMDEIFGDSTNISNPALDLALSMAFIVFFIAFVFGAIGLLLYAIFGNVSRFHKNLFTDEGYLMNTLPVPSHSHILCKLISGLVWYAVTFIIVMAGVALAFGDIENFKIFPYGLINELFGDGWAYAVITYVLGIVTYSAFLLLCYMGEGMSSMMGGKKGLAVLTIIAALILNSIVSTLISTLVISGIGINVYDSIYDMGDTYLVVYGVRLIYYTIVSIALFFLTNLIIKDHLNLE